MDRLGTCGQDQSENNIKWVMRSKPEKLENVLENTTLKGCWTR